MSEIWLGGSFSTFRLVHITLSALIFFVRFIGLVLLLMIPWFNNHKYTSTFLLTSSLRIHLDQILYSINYDGGIVIIMHCT